MVARPWGVFPSILVKSALHAKWSDQDTVAVIAKDTDTGGIVVDESTGQITIEAHPTAGHYLGVNQEDRWTSEYSA